MRIESLVRYPVKGLGPDVVLATNLEAGGAMPFDREFAIAHGGTKFDTGTPQYLEKHHFMMLMRNPPMAALKTEYDASRKYVKITFPDGAEVGSRLDDADDRQLLERALSDYVGDQSRGGSPRIVSAKNHRFFDVPENYLSLINLASVAELGLSLGEQLDPIRFRANIYVTDLSAWKETGIVGRELACGNVRLRVADAIGRCAATNVNPASAKVDVNVPYSLRKNFDTLNMGLYLEVLDGGRLETGAWIDILK